MHFTTLAATRLSVAYLGKNRSSTEFMKSVNYSKFIFKECNGEKGGVQILPSSQEERFRNAE